jgi:hypothetical protein
MRNIIRRYFKGLIPAKDIIAPEQYIVQKSSNLFIGGITGRTGTTWLMRVLNDLINNDYLIIGEHGSFVLSQLRNAGYEYYQVTPGDKINKKYYLRFLYNYTTKYAYKRRNIYGTGLNGLSEIVPLHVVKIVFDAMQNELANTTTLADVDQCIGRFYSRLLNYYSLKNGNTLNWISKEPPYGRHIDDLYKLIPDCKVVVMTRDGRDTALSMAKRNWCNGDLIQCIDQWNSFTKMTLSAMQRIPNDICLVVKYEDLVNDFERKIEDILHFYQIDITMEIMNKIRKNEIENLPKTGMIGKWKNNFSPYQVNYFSTHCSDSMNKLGYIV